jgi:hypothetical protein
MAYTIDLFHQVNDDRCVSLFNEIQQVCSRTVANFNVIVGLRPGSNFLKRTKIESSEALSTLCMFAESMRWCAVN